MTNAEATTPTEPQRGLLDPAVVHTVAVWAVLAAALLVIGPIVSAVGAGVDGPTGGRHATLLNTDHPLAAIATLAVGLVLAGGLGVASARFIGPRVGLIAAGAVLVWPAWTLGRAAGVLQADPSAGVLRAMALEGLLVGVLVTLLAAATLAARPVRSLEGKAVADHLALRNIASPAAGLALAISAVAALLVAAGIALSPQVGQAIAAVIGGTVIGAAAARAVAQQAPLIAIIAGAGAAAVIAPLYASMQAGDLAAAVDAGTVSGLALISPLQWGAGLLIGVPLGDAWAESLLTSDAEGDAPAKA
jgi:hypothetical protein